MASFWKKIRADFPITQESIYLDHAAGGPIARPVAEKIQHYYEENIREADFAWMKWMRRREEVRAKVARFIHAKPEEITFVNSTSQGMNWVAELIAKKGKVLLNDSEFPSSTVPWLWRKSKVVWQKTKDSKVSLKKLKTLLKPEVKTVVSSYVQYATGFRQDLQKLGTLKGNRFLVVNATQGFGALPINVERWNADFLMTNSYKWMMAGYGGGILYIKKKWLAKFFPDSVGWRSMKDPDKMDNRGLDVRTDGGRYEWGCPAFQAIFGVGAAIDYFNQTGVKKIEKRILELTDYLIERLVDLGFEVVSPLEPEHRSGIVVFKVKNPLLLWKRFLGAGIYVSNRGAGIRVAPHFYNSFDEIDLFLKKLKAFSK